MHRLRDHRVEDADHDLSLGATEIDLSEPRRVRTVDAEGYVHLAVHDSLGRLREDHEGRGAALTQTGAYKYDGRDRITRFTDAGGNAYRYDYDLLGRLTQVYRKADCTGVYGPCSTAEQPWYGYAYDGPDPTELWEGTRGSGTLAVAWEHDPLGRPVEKQILDRTSNTFDVHDLRGNRVETTWPSGATVAAQYEPYAARISRYEVSATHNATEHTQAISLAYNEWGQPSSWSSWMSRPSGTVLLYHEEERSSPTRVDRLRFSRGGPEEVIDYAYAANGLLEHRALSSSQQTFEYQYDDLQRVARVDSTFVLPGPPPTPATWWLEDFDYDALGRPTRVKEPGAVTWDYEPGAFSQVHRRVHDSASPKPPQTHNYDGQGRMTRADEPGTVETFGKRFDYRYDGAGRVVAVDRSIAFEMGPGLISSSLQDTTTYLYDASDRIVEEANYDEHLLRHQGYRIDGNSGQRIEKLLPMLSVENRPGTSSPWRWTLVEPDGHALETYDGTAETVLSRETLGPYGRVYASSGAAAWPIDGFHGAEPDKASGAVHHGARHMLSRGDGLWLQPEPLLYLGMTNGNLAQPRMYGGVYAGGNPVMLGDRSGYTPIAIPLLIFGEIALPPALVGGAAAVVVFGGCYMLSPCHDFVFVGGGPTTVSGAPAQATGGDKQAESIGGWDVEPAEGGPGLGTTVDLDDPSIQVVDGPQPGMTGDQGGGSIYEVPGSGTKSGKPYIGRHDGPNPARDRKSNDGRDRTQAEVIGGYDPAVPGAGAEAEQDAIDAAGGIDNLDNKINATR